MCDRPNHKTDHFWGGHKLVTGAPTILWINLVACKPSDAPSTQSMQAAPSPQTRPHSNQASRRHQTFDCSLPTRLVLLPLISFLFGLSTSAHSSLACDSSNCHRCTTLAFSSCRLDVKMERIDESDSSCRHCLLNRLQTLNELDPPHRYEPGHLVSYCRSAL